MGNASIQKFLDDRLDRLVCIEILATFIREIGNSAESLNASNFVDFFGFLQAIPLAQLIFIQFIAVIGDLKKGDLEAWQSFDLEDDAKSMLTEIRKRYAGARNIIAHIETKYEVTKDEKTADIECILSDVQRLKVFLQKVRVQNNLNVVLSSEVSERSMVKSLRLLLRKISEQKKEG